MRAVVFQHRVAGEGDRAGHHAGAAIAGVAAAAELHVLIGDVDDAVDVHGRAAVELVAGVGRRVPILHHRDAPVGTRGGRAQRQRGSAVDVDGGVVVAGAGEYDGDPTARHG